MKLDEWVAPEAMAVAVLREQLLARASNGLGLVFRTPSGAVWRKNNFMARVFRPAVRRAELAPPRFHDLRHTYAALMIAARAHPTTLNRADSGRPQRRQGARQSSRKRSLATRRSTSR